MPDTQLDLPADQPLEVELRLITPVAPATDTSRDVAAGMLDITALPFFGMWADRVDMADRSLGWTE